MNRRWSSERMEPDAFGLVGRALRDRALPYIYHRAGNVQDAEDPTARTFYRALEKPLDTYEDRGCPFRLAFRIAHNLVANWHRDQQPAPGVFSEKPQARSHDGAQPDEAVEAEGA